MVNVTPEQFESARFIHALARVVMWLFWAGVIDYVRRLPNIGHRRLLWALIIEFLFQAAVNGFACREYLVTKQVYNVASFDVATLGTAAWIVLAIDLLMVQGPLIVRTLKAGNRCEIDRIQKLQQKQEVREWGVEAARRADETTERIVRRWSEAQ